MFDSDGRALEKRLEDLERSHLRLKRFAGAGLVAAAVVVLSGHSQSARVIAAERFVLVDANGTEWGYLGVHEFRPGVGIPVLDLHSGNSEAMLMVTRAFTKFSLKSPHGMTAALSVVDSLGRYSRPRAELRLESDTMNPQQLLDLLNRGGPSPALSPGDAISLVFSPTKRGERPSVQLSPSIGWSAALSTDSSGALLASDPDSPGSVMRKVALQRP